MNAVGAVPLYGGQTMGWIVEGVPVSLHKITSEKKLVIAVPYRAFDKLSDDAILRLLDFVHLVAERFRKVVPEGWQVCE